MLTEEQEKEGCYVNRRRFSRCGQLGYRWQLSGHFKTKNGAIEWLNLMIEHVKRSEKFSEDKG